MATLPPPVRWNLLVWLALLAVQAVAVVDQYEAYTFLHGDGAFYATVNRSLLDGTLAQRAYQPQSWYEQALGWNHELGPGWSNVALGQDGTWWPKHPLLLPILATPLFFLLRWDGLLLFNVLGVVTALWCAFRIARRYTRPEVAAAVVLAVACLPLFARGVYSYSNDVLYAALVLGSIERFLAGRFGWSGFLAGLALWAKPTNVILLGPLGAALLVQRQWRPALQMAGWAALPMTVHLAMNAWMFGHPLVTSYHRVLVVKAGQPVVMNHLATFGRPFWPGLKTVLLDPDQGLVRNAWLTFGGLLGLPWLVRLAPALAVALGLSLVGFCLIYAPFEFTYARFFTPWAALLAVPLAVAADRGLLAWARLAPGLADTARWLGWRRGVPLLLAAVALVVVAVHLGRRPAGRWQAAQVITQAVVTRGPADKAIPCDYFNPNHQKWECAQIERDGWMRWGLALGEQCRFADGSRGWLWLHPQPEVDKRITFKRLPPGPVRLRWGLAPTSRAVGLRLAVRSGLFERSLQTGPVGQVQQIVLPARERADSVTLEVPSQAHDWRHLCVDLRID